MATKYTGAVKGKLVDEESRCIHYHSPLDVIAIKMKCCDDYYPCIECHNEATIHSTELWKQHEFDMKAILCGVCKNELTINQYLNCNNQCPFCTTHFNPRCSNHYHLYFDVDITK